MANNKKFIVKNGLLTQENIVVGSAVDNGVDKLQVTGTTSITQATGTSPSLKVTNSGGTSNSIVAEFSGDSDSLRIVNFGIGDYALLNSQQNNGIRFYDDASGLELLYNGVSDLALTSAGIDFKRSPTVNSNTIWHAGNDGTGSGLDADLLDGLDSTQFLRSDEDDTMNGSLTITGNLTVQGTTTTINTETILLADNIITLNSNYTGSTPTENAGFEIERGTLTNSSLVWDETNDWWKLTSSGTDLGRIITTADEGDGNGFDADTVDGLHAAQFLRSDADDTATGNIIFQGQITVGNNTAAGATIVMDGQAGNRYIYSNNGEIGFLNSAFAYAAYSDASNNWRVLNDVYAKRFIDADNNTYLLDPAATSVVNTVDLEGQIRHNGDTDTYITFPAVDQFEVRTGGTARLTVTNSAVTATQDFVGPRFVDSGNNAYYADPASASVFNTLGIDSDLFHNGDTDNKISFGTDTQTFQTGGTTRLTINNTAVTSSVDFVGPRFVDSANSNKFADPAGTSEFTSANFYNGSTTANNEVNIGRSLAERFNINVTDGQGYIRYYQDETDNTDHSVNFEIISAGNGLNRFNFNKNINVSGSIIASVDAAIAGSVYGEIFYDYTDPTYFADLNNTGNSINVAGTIRAGNGSLAAPTYTFGSDTNTGMYRYAADTIGFSAGGNDEFRIYTTYALAVGQMRSPIFYDSNNTAYYGDFASTSIMNRIDIDDYIRHNGDTDTYFGFSATDTIVAVTANTTRLTINTTGVTSTLDVTAPNFYGARFYDSGNAAYYADPASTSVFNRVGIDSDIFHNGDTDNKISFTTDAMAFDTGGTTRLSISNLDVIATVDMYAPRFYTNDYLYHNGDNSYIGFDSNDNFGVWTNGTQAIDVNSSSNVGIGAAADATYKLYVNGNYKQTTSTNAVVTIDGNELSMTRPDAGPFYIVNNGGTTVSIDTVIETDNVNKRVLVGGGNLGYTPSAVLTIMKGTAQGTNPFAAGTSLLSLGDLDVADFSIRTDSLRNIWNIVESTGQLVYADSGASIFLAMDASTGDVIVGDQTAQFATPDGAPTFLAALDANKLHVNGGIQLNGIANALSIYAADAGNTAINEATFLAVNELGFSAGGGFYMDETTTVKIRGNKALNTTGNITGGNMYAARFYDADDNTYYGDFATTSRVNDISLVGQIIHDGDTNTYLDFNAADSFQVVTGGSARLTVNNTSVTATDAFDAPIFRDSGNTAYTLNGNTSNAWRISTPSGYVDVGPQNTSYSHFQTDRPKFYFNKTAAFDGGGIEAYDASATASFPIYYDWDDTFYYGNFAGFSRMNGITFGNPGNGANTKGRWLSIEGNTDASGEGSARIFFAEHNSTTASQDLYGVALAYRGGSDTVNSATGQPTTLTGLNDGEWGLLGYDNNVNGNWAMKGPRDASYVQARVAFRAPRFEDSNDVNYYGDFAGTSLTNIMRANQFQVDGSTYIIDSPSGDYGTIKVEGAKGGTWAGFAIRDDWVFMADGATNAGIYNDTDNEWAIQFTRNGGTDLSFDGIKQGETENGYFLATNQMRAPIYYAPGSTSYWLDLDVANTSDALRIPGRINRQGFAADGGSTNVFLTSQDQNHFIWNTATNWGIFWATNTSASYRYAPFGDNMITFVGAGNTRAAIDLDNGNAYFQGEVTAANFRINGGNEDLGILKTYGSGLGDTMLFDGTEYWEKRVIQTMQGAENSATTTTSEFVKNGDGPFASSYALRTAAYRDFYSDYIPVEPGEEIYGEIAVRYISGTGGLLYYGVERFDKDKNPIAGNNGTTYFVVSAVNYTGTGWTTYRGHTTIPTTHTPYNGSDGAGVRYVRIRVLMNHSAGGALREFGPPILKRTNHLSNILAQGATFEGDVYADRYYDRNNASFYVDPASTSIMNIIDASNFRDRDNTARYMDPATGGSVAGTWNWNNGSITDLNDISFADPGPNEGIHWKGGNNWRIYESPDNLTTNGAGNLQILYNNNQVGLRINTSGDGTFGRYAYAQRFYDSNDGNYYGDFASTSVFNQAIFSNATPLRFTTTSTALFDHESNSTPVAFRMNKGGTTLSDGSNYGVLQLSRTNHNNAATSAGAGLYFTLKDSAGTLREYAGIYGRKTVAGTGGGELVFMNYNRNEVAYINAGYISHATEIRAPLFRDSDDTTYYVDPASTSITNTMRASRFEVDSATYYIDGISGQYGSIRVSGNNNGYAGYAINDDWVFMSGGASLAGIYNDTNNEWAAIFRQNAEVELYYNGVIQAETQNGYFLATNEIRSPIFRDSNDSNFYVDPNSNSRILNLDVTGSLTVAGYAQNNPVEGQWYQTNTYIYDATNGTRHYWIRVGRTNNGGAKGILEYYSKSDVNYSTNAIGRVVISSWSSSSISVDHHTTGPQNGVTPEVRIDNSNYLWLRMVGNTWDSWLRWKWVRADGITPEDGSTKIDALGGAVPPNSSPTILSGQQTRATMGNVTGATITNTTNYFGGVYSRGPVYGSIFYDSDDGNYYGDFASTSRMNAINVNSTSHVGGGIATFLSSSGNARGYIQATETNDAHLIIATSGGEDISFRDGGVGGDWNMIIRGDGNVFTRAAHYAEIFYDRNDSTYKGDFASTSVMNILDIRGEIYNDGWFRNDVSGRGLYNTATTQHFYSDDDDGWNVAGGSSANWIRFRDEIGGTIRGYVYADNGNNIGFLNQSGSWALRTNSGTTEVYGSIYANSFVDRNNNGYYVDPAGTTQLNTVYIDNRLIFNASVSTNDNRGIFFDGSSGGDNQPYAIYRENGAWSNPYPDLRIAFHTGIKMGANPNYNGIRFYDDYQMVNQVMSINNAADGLGANNVYVNNHLVAGNSLRAPIFYDSLDPSFYVDPSATSNLSSLNVLSGDLYVNTIKFRTRSGGTSSDPYMLRFVERSGNQTHLELQLNDDADEEFRIYGYSCSGYGCGEVSGNLYHRFRTDGYAYHSNVLEVGGSVRAPVFVDLNDANYYLDPAGASNLGTSIRATEIYARNWFRNDQSGEGLYNQQTGMHFYSPGGSYFHMASNNNNNAISLQFRGAYNGSQKAWIYGDGSWQGFLNSAGSWKLRMIHVDTYSPSIRFEENGDENWTGNPGADVGKIEYHANRFYIASGSNSDRIVQFRRDGTDRSWIANDGVFVGTATSARWADLAERYEADAIYEAGTVLGIGGDKEVTLYQPGMPLAGAISTKPAYRMNDEDYGNDNSLKSKMNPFIALKGRIPVKINGSAKKGQWIIADKDGKGRAVDYGTPGINTFDIIGIALENGENEVEVKI